MTTLGADTSIVIFTDKSVTTAIMRRKNVEPRGLGLRISIAWGQKSKKKGVSWELVPVIRE